MKEILKNEFVRVAYDQPGNAIITIWNKPTTSEEYRAIVSKILEIIMDYKAKAFIIDIYQQGIVGIENRLWLRNEMLPKAYQAGLRKVATISPNDVFSRYYMDSIRNGHFANSMDLEFQYFQDLSTAITWIMNDEVAA